MSQNSLQEAFAKQDNSESPLQQDWIKDVTVDSNSISFSADLTFMEEFEAVKIICPSDTFPKGRLTKHVTNLLGTYKVIVKDEEQDFEADSLEAAIEHAVEFLETKRDEAANELLTPTPTSAPESPFPDTPTLQKDFWGSDDGEAHVDEVKEQMKKDTDTISQTKGWFAQPGEVTPYHAVVHLFIDPNRFEISDLIANAWGIELDKYITITLKFAGLYTNSTNPPVVNTYQCGDVKKKQYLNDNISKYGQGWSVEQRLKEFFHKYWPIKKYNEQIQQKTGKNFIYGVIELAEHTIKNCTKTCLICNKDLPYIGVKPAVCDSQLCIFSREQYGIGVALESDIKQTPDLVDLMITLAHAACNHKSKINPLNPFPTGIEVKDKDKKGKIIKHTFTQMNELDNSKVTEVLDLIPRVSVMSKWVDEGVLKERLDERHRLIYPLLKWLLASNRAHLKKLTKQEQIADMNTPHQYYLMSNPPEREKKFQELKKKYGSSWAFHGSALYNWHSILRIGLKNMSGTKGQLNGAAYGQGVYLADDASTSFSYTRYQKGWDNSMFGNGKELGCVALCEIIRHPDLKGQPNPYYVVKKDELISTRYFFIYEGRGSSRVKGKLFKPPTIKW